MTQIINFLKERVTTDGANYGAWFECASAQTKQQFRLFASVALTVLLIGLCFLLAVPFLPAITWSVALAIIAWPMHRWIGAYVKRPVLASILSTAAVVILIVAPSLFVSYELAIEGATIADKVRVENNDNIRERIAEATGLGNVVAWMDRMDLQIEAEVRKIIGSYTQDAAGVVQGSLALAIQFLVAIFILYFLFLDRGTFLHGVRELLPLSKTESDTVFARAADSVHANLYATVLTSLIDAVGGGFMFWMLGIPSPLLWAVVMFFLSVLPVVGAGLVWFPAAIFLALTDRWLAGLALLGWGLMFFIIVDNILYVRLAGKRMRMHEVTALIAFLGGIAVFGLSGIILGPAILAVTIAFLQIWKSRLLNEQVAEIEGVRGKSF